MTSKINEAAEKAAQVPVPKRRRVPVWLWVAGPLAVPVVTLSRGQSPGPHS